MIFYCSDYSSQTTAFLKWDSQEIPSKGKPHERHISSLETGFKGTMAVFIHVPSYLGVKCLLKCLFPPPSAQLPNKKYWRFYSILICCFKNLCLRLLFQSPAFTDTVPGYGK